MKLPELKLCPFCGGEALLCEQSESDGQVSYKVAYVECDVCGCNTGSYIIDGYYGATTTKEDAIKAWNRRVDDGDGLEPAIRFFED